MVPEYIGRSVSDIEKERVRSIPQLDSEDILLKEVLFDGEWYVVERDAGDVLSDLGCEKIDSMDGLTVWTAPE